MCSYICPCDVTKLSAWYALDDNMLNSYGRTKYPRGTGSNSDLRWDASGNIRLYQADASTKAYSNFAECANLILDAKEAEEQKAGYDATNSPYKDVPSRKTIETGVSLLSFFESKYACSGVCESALFFYSLDLNEGVPSSTCLSDIKEEIGG